VGDGDRLGTRREIKSNSSGRSGRWPCSRAQDGGLAVAGQQAPAVQIRVIGVLPVPPTVMLPTEITGMGSQ